MAIFTFLLLWLYLTPAGPGDGKSTPTNEFVALRYTLKESRLKSGSEGVLLMTLSPVKGIHVNLIPPMSFTFDSSAVLASAGTLVIPPDSAKGYLDATKPVRQPFRLSKPLKPGKHTVTGTFIYYYCSDAEGWCSRFRQPISLTLEVVK